jgi:hypothetical protein
METAAATGHGPGQALNRLAISATTHCLTGCAIGEITGFVIATALGWSDIGQIALAVGLAYVFGFALTAVPLVRAGLADRNASEKLGNGWITSNSTESGTRARMATVAC